MSDSMREIDAYRGRLSQCAYEWAITNLWDVPAPLKERLLQMSDELKRYEQTLPEAAATPTNEDDGRSVVVVNTETDFVQRALRHGDNAAPSLYAPPASTEAAPGSGTRGNLKVRTLSCTSEWIRLSSDEHTVRIVIEDSEDGDHEVYVSLDAWREIQQFQADAPPIIAALRALSAELMKYSDDNQALLKQTSSAAGAAFFQGAWSSYHICADAIDRLLRERGARP